MFEAEQISQTIRHKQRTDVAKTGRYITVFDGEFQPKLIDLDAYKKDVVTFGRNENMDVVFHSRLVSRTHGQFVRLKGQWYIENDENSANGILYHENYITRCELSEGGIFRIANPQEDRLDSVMLLVSTDRPEENWNMLPVQDGAMTIGREEQCYIHLDHITVSRLHARITWENNAWYIQDLNSANGLLLNGVHKTEKTMLHEKDVITITNTTIIFTLSAIYYFTSVGGVSVEARDIVVKRGKGKKSFITSDHVNMSIKPGELVSIIGGSGAGKSTIMNVLCGYLPPAEGTVYINGCDLYKNFEAMKSLFGYVPQSDIVYNDLSLYDMLKYTAQLRLPGDMSVKERDAAIQRALATVDLEEHKDKLIKNLSGGQRKRASIAVELLPDPKLLFLDEPVSGLDPGTERDLMLSLRRMTRMGKTIILVTHSTLQLGMCDKVAFMGKGGKLCFLGNLSSALAFFDVDDVVDIYQKITDDSPNWQEKYNQTNPVTSVKNNDSSAPARQKKHRIRQQNVLCKRYTRLLTNDHKRMRLLLLQAPLLAFLISLVANGKQFEQYDMTKSLLFALSCSACWLGLLNAIQEICKERTILKREYMTGLSLSAYLSSKILVLGVLSLIQSALLVGAFILLVGSPEEGVMIHPVAELFITTWLTAISSAAMGLFVSALSPNPDRAMTVAPLLLMPQMLFSGLLFKLSGATEYISWFAVCRWSMEGFGTTSNLNGLPTALQQQGLPITREAEAFFELTTEHLLTDWGIMVAFVVVFLALALLVLPRIKKESD